MREAGTEVHVLAGPADAVDDPPMAARRALRRLPEPLRGAHRDASSFVLGAAWAARVVGRIRPFQPTALIERAQYLDPSGAILANRLGVPYIVELHGMLAADAKGYYRSPFEPLGSLYERVRYRHVDAVVAVSEGLRRFAVDMGARRAVVIPNGVDLPTAVAPRAEAVAKLRRTLDLPDRRIVGWIGHLMDWQASSIEDLCEALAVVGRSTPVALVVVGTMGSSATAMLDRAEIPVRMLGQLPRDAADDVVRGFEVGFVPGGLDYALPVKLFQYAALEVPIVAPMLGSIAAFAAGRELFFGYADGDRLGIANALREALRAEDGEDRVRELHELVMSEHSWRAVARHLLEVVDGARRP